MGHRSVTRRWSGKMLSHLPSTGWGAKGEMVSKSMCASTMQINVDIHIKGVRLLISSSM